MVKPKGNEQGPGAVLVDMAEQMAIFDSLPPRLRTLINALPTKEELGSIAMIYQRYGDRALSMIEGVFDFEFPGWRDPEAPSKGAGKSIRDRRISKRLKGLSK